MGLYAWSTVYLESQLSRKCLTSSALIWRGVLSMHVHDIPQHRCCPQHHDREQECADEVHHFPGSIDKHRDQSKNLTILLVPQVQPQQYARQGVCDSPLSCSHVLCCSLTLKPMMKA